MGEDMHQIGEVAAAVGLSLRTIRHYEEVELVPPSGRTAGGFRLYTDDDIDRLRLVKALKPLQFTLDEVRQLLEVRDQLRKAQPATAEHEGLQEVLAGFVVVADERCERLREQLRASESVAELLREESTGRSPASRAT